MAEATNTEKDLTLEEQLAKIKGEQAEQIAKLEKQLAERDAMIKKYLTSGGGEKTDETSNAEDEESAYITAEAEKIKSIIQKWRS